MPCHKLLIYRDRGLDIPLGPSGWVHEDLLGPSGEISETCLAVWALQDHEKVALLASPLQHIN